MFVINDETTVDGKVKKSVTSSIKKVPLSNTTTLRRVELLAKEAVRKKGFLMECAFERNYWGLFR